MLPRVVAAPIVDASEKLRLVLDYVPCEVCLSQASHDQEVLCSLCARLHRQVGIRVTRKTSVIVERPEPPAPVIIPAASEAPPDDAPPAPVPIAPTTAVEVVLHGEKRKARRDTAAIEVVVEPWEEPSAVAAVAAAPLAANVDAPVEDEWDDVASFEPGDEAPFEFTDKPARGEPERAPEPFFAPREEPPAEPAEEPPEDDFIFRPPAADEPAEAAPEPEPEWAPPTEEVPVEREDDAPSPWARPADTDFLQEEAPPAEPEPAPEPEPIQELAPVEEEILDTEIVETTVVEEPAPEPAPPEEILEMEMVEDEPVAAPLPPDDRSSDLFRLRGFGNAHFEALAANRIESITHLAGHDPSDLARRTGIPVETLIPWVQAANLVHEVGVPIDAAIAMVAAGVPGPRGLAEMDEQTIVDRVAAFGGAQLSARDVKRWKRRV